MGFPGDSDGNESSCSVGDPGLIPGLGRSPRKGNSNPLQYSCLKNPMKGGAWQSIVHVVAKGQTWLSDFTFFLSMLHDISFHKSKNTRTYYMLYNHSQTTYPRVLIVYKALFLAAFLVAQTVKNPPAIRQTWVWPLDWEGSLGGGHGNPLQCSCLKNPHGQRSPVG